MLFNKVKLLLGGVLLSSISTLSFAAGSVGEEKHFHGKGKLPSKYTIEAQAHQRKILPLTDKRDFEEAKKGFIAEPEYRQITRFLGAG